MLTRQADNYTGMRHKMCIIELQVSLLTIMYMFWFNFTLGIIWNFSFDLVYDNIGQ